MNGSSILTFWTFILFRTFNLFFTQETEDYIDAEFMPPEYYHIVDGEALHLNSSYCLERISAQIISSSIYGDHNRSLFYIKIMWKSKNFMNSIKMESDSMNDSYCGAENKHYYNRKPLNQAVHVFPDDVNEGIRFLPIKLDCKYVITPELEGLCRPVKFKYSTPVCIDNETCSCRHVLIPAPSLEAELVNEGVNIIWYIPKEGRNNISRIVISVYSEDGININKIAKRKIFLSNFKGTNKNMEFFQVNVTDGINYRILGYFENRINCHGNSTFLRFRDPVNLDEFKYQRIISYAIAFACLFLFLVMSLLLLGKRLFKRIWRKFFRSESEEAPTVEYFNENCNRKNILLPQMVYNPTYVGRSRDSYWFDYRDLVIVKKIGSGNFGVVYLAYSSVGLKGFNEFAVKQIKENAGPEDVAEFIEEINTFKMVGSHPNVVKMLGYCTEPHPLTIVMEYVPFSLLKYLNNLRTEFEKRKTQNAKEFSVNYAELSHSRSCSTLDYNYISQDEVESIPLRYPKNVLNDKLDFEYLLDNRELELFGLQIARGMAHLESKNIIHRDLAARNILMDSMKNLKISDFGMSRTGIYVNKRTKKFPLRWMSPEALINRIFSNKSDVWSFGVVLWEIGTLGAYPYSSLQNEEVISLLEKGGHLDKPEYVTRQLYEVMVDCWSHLPEDRPTFKDLVRKIERFCEKFDQSSAYVFPIPDQDLSKQ